MKHRLTQPQVLGELAEDRSCKKMLRIGGISAIVAVTMLYMMVNVAVVCTSTQSKLARGRWTPLTTALLLPDGGFTVRDARGW